MDIWPLEGKAIESEKAAEASDSSIEESHNQMPQIKKDMKMRLGGSQNRSEINEKSMPKPTSMLPSIFDRFFIDLGSKGGHPIL